MAGIGATPKGGVNRLTLTDLDGQSRELFARWCKEAGCTVSVDRIGSMFARREGADDTLPPVMLGSHLDTQPTGGKFDGALGVMAALEVVRTMNDLDIKTRHPIEIAMWTNEEGSRFAPAMDGVGRLCRRVQARRCAGHQGRGRQDHRRLSWSASATPVRRRSAAGRCTPSSSCTSSRVRSWRRKASTSASSPPPMARSGTRSTLTGVESHAGPTPMNRRKDALLGAARIVELVNKIGHDHDPAACATVGMIQSHPNSRNVIPGRVFLTVDFRHPDIDKLTRWIARCVPAWPRSRPGPG